MPKEFVFGWFPSIYTEYCPILSQYSPMLSQNGDNWCIIIPPAQLSWRGVHWIHLLLLCLVTINQQQDRAFVPRSHFDSSFYQSSKFCIEKLKTCCALYYHLLESYSSSALFVSWNILCFIFWHVCTVCIWDTIFHTKIKQCLLFTQIVKFDGISSSSNSITA